MVHQYIYIIHDNTDDFGWQYRSDWPQTPVPGPRDEPWTNQPYPFSRVRRRIWMTTIVPRQELVKAKRLLSENVRIDSGIIKLQGELNRYEKGTLTKSWNRRRVVLLHNRIEFYSGNSKKGEALLNDCEVKILTPEQCQGKKYAFSIRNPSGSVGILLEADDPETRRAWILAIQYQLAMNSHEVNFQPLEYSPPTGEYPDNRVFISSDLKLLGRENQLLSRHFQLSPREIVCFNEDDELRGRIFVEQANISADERNLNFTISSASGITIQLTAENPEVKNTWLLGVRRQVQFIENQKLKQKTVPKEELDDDNIPIVDRISQFYDENWTAPAVEGEDEDYLHNIFLAPHRNHPEHYEFMDDLGINMDPRLRNSRSISESKLSPIQGESDSDNEKKQKASHATTPANPGKFLDSKRILINPRFMVSALKTVQNHRFVLILECEYRINAPKDIANIAPPRFSVGGLKASKDPRIVPLDQLIGISNQNPEIQFPAGNVDSLLLL